MLHSQSYHATSYLRLRQSNCNRRADNWAPLSSSGGVLYLQPMQILNPGLQTLYPARNSIGQGVHEEDRTIRFYWIHRPQHP